MKERDVAHGHCLECGDYMEYRSFLPHEDSCLSGIKVWVCRDCILKAGSAIKFKKYEKTNS